MKKPLLFFTILFAGVSTFRGKTPVHHLTDDEITINSPLQLKCEMEGDNLHYLKKKFHYIENKDSAKTLSQKILIYDDDYSDTCHLMYKAGFCHANTKEGFMLTRGFLNSLNGRTPTEVKFISLFVMGKYVFAERKAELEYTDIDGNRWTTVAGDQTGSSFEIADYLSTGDADNRACKVLMKFNCKLYNKNFTSKFLNIKNGVAVLEFAH